MLLELSEEAARAVDGFATEILKRTVADGRLHDASMYITTAATGLTFHSRTEWTQEGGRRLLSHCGLRKYVQKAERWVWGGVATGWRVGFRRRCRRRVEEKSRIGEGPSKDAAEAGDRDR